MTTVAGVPWFALKQPTEAYYVQFDFTDVVGDSTLSSAVVAAVDTADDSVVTSTITDVAQQSVGDYVVSVWLKAAGMTGKVYKITCLATAADGSKYELDAYLPVRAL